MVPESEIQACSTEESSSELLDFPEVEIAGEYQLIKKTLSEVCAEIDQVFHADPGAAWKVIGPVFERRKSKIANDVNQRIWEIKTTGPKSALLKKLKTSDHDIQANLSWSVFSLESRVPVLDAVKNIVRINNEVQMRNSISVGIAAVSKWDSRC